MKHKVITADLVDVYRNRQELAECVENDGVHTELKVELSKLRSVLEEDYGIEIIFDDDDTPMGVYFDR